VIFNAQGQPEGTPPGMTPGLNNGAYQPLYPQAPAAGMPATGPVAGLGGLTPQQYGAGAGDLMSPEQLARLSGAPQQYGAGAGDLMSPQQLAQLGGTPNRDPGFTNWNWQWPNYQPTS
jgi:hypothetical protein